MQMQKSNTYKVYRKSANHDTWVPELSNICNSIYFVTRLQWSSVTMQDEIRRQRVAMAKHTNILCKCTYPIPTKYTENYERYTSKYTSMEMLFTNNDSCEDNVICQVALLLYAMETVSLMKQKYKVPLDWESKRKAYPIITEAFTGTWPSMEFKCSVSSISKPELVVFSEK